MPQYRKIFPSYDWDDAWYVNQIVNLPNIVGKEYIGFIKDVPNEEVKSSDAAIKAWIDLHMTGCSCLILFCGERTHLSKWVKYELELAETRSMGRFIVHLVGMTSRYGTTCGRGTDPYRYHGMYNADGQGYVIQQYDWVYNDGQRNVSAWIEDACSRIGR